MRLASWSDIEANDPATVAQIIQHVGHDPVYLAPTADVAAAPNSIATTDTAAPTVEQGARSQALPFVLVGTGLVLAIGVAALAQQRRRSR
jgi:hypothetical protein